MNSKLNSLLFSGFCFLIFFSGIIRHDVKEKYYLNLGKEPQFDCVGQVYRDTLPVGSCVLIDSLHVLSAAHVFIEYNFRLETIKKGKETVIANIPYNGHVGRAQKFYFIFNGIRYQGATLKIYPAFLDSSTINTCDIALIKLNKPVSNIVPAQINHALDELHSNVVGVGYGASGIANKLKSVSYKNKKMAGENVIDTLTGYLLYGNRTILTSDFDSPKDKTCNKMGDSKPRPLEYIFSGGDSGGGLFREVNSSWQLIGICSRTDFDLMQQKKTGYYGATMGWTRVSVFSEWILKEKN